jgi:hypothetical protein
MIEAGGSWGVRYADGSEYLRYAEDGTENAWAAIRWPDVVSVVFASAQAEGEFAFQHPGDGWDVRLGSRLATTPVLHPDGPAPQGVRAFMIVTHAAGRPIRPETVARVFFWFPDGVFHDCDDYNCPQVQDRLHALVHGLEPAALAQAHSRLSAGASAVLA